jgi:hypothetical protein
MSFDNINIIRNIANKLERVDYAQNNNQRVEHIIDLYQYMVDNFDKIILFENKQKFLNISVKRANDIIEHYSNNEGVEGEGDGENYIVNICSHYIDLVNSIAPGNSYGN